MIGMRFRRTAARPRTARANGSASRKPAAPSNGVTRLWLARATTIGPASSRAGAGGSRGEPAPPGDGAFSPGAAPRDARGQRRVFAPERAFAVRADACRSLPRLAALRAGLGTACGLGLVRGAIGAPWRGEAARDAAWRATPGAASIVSPARSAPAVTPVAGAAPGLCEGAATTTAGLSGCRPGGDSSSRRRHRRGRRFRREDRSGASGVVTTCTGGAGSGDGPATGAAAGGETSPRGGSKVSGSR